LYQEWHLTSKAILVSISLSFFSVYSINPSAPPHVSWSHLHMNHSRCTINSSFNQPIIFCSVINHSFPPHSREAPSTLPISYVQPLSLILQPILDDLAQKILQMSSGKCFPLSPTSYPKISARRILMQPEHHPL
jgi:hypothetical protein